MILLRWPECSGAVGADGEFYSLTAPGGLRAQLTGARLTPTPPRLIVEEGSRGGEPITLAAPLELGLAESIEG